MPEARIASAHGKMPEHRLEQVMVDFWNRQYDVLVCTTIVESGLDIANANTLVVERADLLGLSQLHQLRGRVGRGRERAYAYFLYPPERPMTETAHDRLETIAQHTDLGAGMHVAMKDLEIRGAGNLLGAEQSGYIAGVGFDLYVRMVGEAVAEFRGKTQDEHVEVKIDLPVDAHLPHDYIPGERLRLEAYRKIAEITADEQIPVVRAELVDRYGAPPVAVENLLEVARFRVHARRAGLTEVSGAGQPHPLRAGGAAGVRAAAAAAALPGVSGQGRRADDPGAPADDRPDRRPAAARRRGAALGHRPDRRGAAGPDRRRRASAAGAVPG